MRKTFISGAVVVVALAAFFPQVCFCAEKEAMPTAKKIVMVIAKKDFRDEELFTPRSAFESAGLKVFVASSSLETAQGMLGGTAKPDVLLKDVVAEDYDAVVLVGGMGSKEYFESAEAHALALKASAAGKVVAAICLAPVILAKAGLLKGKAATVWQDAKSDIEAGGAKYKPDDVVVEGKIITANGPSASKRFAEAILNALK